MIQECNFDLRLGRGDAKTVLLKGEEHQYGKDMAEKSVGEVWCEMAEEKPSNKTSGGTLNVQNKSLC